MNDTNTITEIKQCIGKVSCSEFKPLSEFGLVSGAPHRRHNACIECRKKYQQQYNKQYRQDNKEYFNDYSKQYRKDNPEKMSEIRNRSYQNHKEEVAEGQKQYRKQNRAKINAKEREKRRTNPHFKLKKIISWCTRVQIKSLGASKDFKSIKQYLPDSIEDVLEHLYALFRLPSNLGPNGEVWMTLENWTTFDKEMYDPKDSSTWSWHLDHIEPQLALPYDTMECDNYRKCWGKLNLRPLKAIQNVSESKRTLEKICAIKEEIRLFLESHKKEENT